MSTGLSRHKLTLVSAAIVNQRGGGHAELTNNVSVSLDKQVNIDLVENYSHGNPPLLSWLSSLAYLTGFFVRRDKSSLS